MPQGVPLRVPGIPLGVPGVPLGVPGVPLGVPLRVPGVPLGLSGVPLGVPEVPLGVPLSSLGGARISMVIPDVTLGDAMVRAWATPGSIFRDSSSETGIRESPGNFR